MELECTMDEHDVVVLDIGSGSIKAGYSGEDMPRSVVPTVCTEKAEGHQALVGQEAWTAATGTKVFPIQRGLMQRTPESEECLEQLLEHTLRNLQHDEELPVLALDMPLNPLANREWMVEFLFEKCRVPSVALFNTAVMSLFSTGRTRGLVVESGEGVTHAVPIFEGYAIPHAVFSMEVAGKDITDELAIRVLADALVPPTTTTQTMQKMKERLCVVSESSNSTDMQDDDEESRSFELPDGTIIQVPGNIRMGAPEVLFNANDKNSLQNICLRAIQTVDLDFRQDLVKTVVVAGGTSMVPGFASRLSTELSALLPTETKKYTHVLADSQRRHAAWIGGSMFASLSTFTQAVITRAEYDEDKQKLKSLISRRTF
eukprot:GEMP01041333.1.p1 GENE.GEMP01041333.1~~GEMP01041333.1.p1  ORF type:complete len:373 (+),score=77.60 GEMP01041333.1:55-1173(+)